MPQPNSDKLLARLLHVERHPEFRHRLTEEELIVCAFGYCAPSFLPVHIDKGEAIQVISNFDRSMAIFEYWLDITFRKYEKRSLIGVGYLRSQSILLELARAIMVPSQANSPLRHLALGPDLREQLSDKERLVFAFANCDPSYLPPRVIRDEAIRVPIYSDQCVAIYHYWQDVAAQEARKRDRQA
ncbi:hypothetical protein C5O75_018640 [Burkholderia cepacia]|uniref:hypothetical protein n=1 Tax=Burkholderia cepacia TaxID=292 RepID=UPI0011B0AFEE|nr:hypothetical protein [Burkholderia cepacia]KAB1590318.1 hypothetical protein C5O75_018640 [Burkholderia cepacia]